MAGRDSITFVLDTPEAIPSGNGEWLLKGWCFTAKPEDRISINLLAGQTKTQAQLGFPRPDVAQHFNNPTLTNCGFVLRFRCPPKTSRVSIIADVNGEQVPLVDAVPVGSYAESNPRLKVRNYLEWIRLKEPGMFWPIEEISRRLKKLAHHPSVSVVLRITDPDPRLLARTLETLAGQYYQNWKVTVLAEEILSEAAQAVLSTLTQINSAIDGDFAVFLDGTDELSPYALLELVRAINDFPEGLLFYSDSDEINEWGLRSQPLFKPDFDLNLLLSYNYFGDMVAIKSSVLAALKVHPADFETASQWDLLIRASELVNPSAIRHIHKNLYHRRRRSAPYSSGDPRKVLEQHAQRAEKKLTVSEGLSQGSMRVRFEAPRQIEVGVLLRAQDGPFQTAVVQLNARARRLHLNPETALRADVLVVINGSLECLNHLFFEELVAQVMREDCGLVTGLAINTRNEIIAAGLVQTPDDRLIDLYAGAKFPDGGYMNQLNLVRCIDSCTETFFATRREFVSELPGANVYGSLSSTPMHVLVRKLSVNARERDRKILFTPYAIATFSNHVARPLPQEPFRTKQPQSNKINPNLFSFERVDEILKGATEAFDG